MPFPDFGRIALSVWLQVTLQYFKPCRGRGCMHHADEDPEATSGPARDTRPLQQAA